MLDNDKLVNIIEAALLTATEPLTVERLQSLFAEDEADRGAVRDALVQLEAQCEQRGYELKRVASGYRFQVHQALSPWISRMWEEKPPRYSRALLETLALIAYKQPVTRGDIEDVRGVAVSTNIVRTLLEREWIRVVGYKEVPGRPAMFGTTKAFLDYFNLKGLDELPALPEIRKLIEPHVEELAQAGPEYAEGLAPDDNRQDAHAEAGPDPHDARDDVTDEAEKRSEADTASAAQDSSNAGDRSAPGGADSDVEGGETATEDSNVAGNGAENAEDVGDNDERA